MTRCYFDVRDSKGFHRDEFGVDLAGTDEAREQCQGLLPDIVREELPDGELPTIMCDVRDEMDRAVCRGEITFRGTRSQTAERYTSDRGDRCPSAPPRTAHPLR